MKKTRILIVEDHKLLRETWSFLFNSHGDFAVLGEAGSGEGAIELAKELAPDVVLMDINLPGINGIKATGKLLKVSPKSKVLAVSLHTQPALVRSIIKEGAIGYLNKNASMEEMFEAIGEVIKGNQYLSKEIRDSLNSDLTEPDDIKRRIHSLSSREIEIIGLIKEGLMSKDIAKKLNIAEGTVEVHRSNIFKKLNVKNSAALVELINNTSLDTFKS